MSLREGSGPGSTLDSFLAEEGILKAATEHAAKSVSAWQIGEAKRDRAPDVPPTHKPSTTQK